MLSLVDGFWLLASCHWWLVVGSNRTPMLDIGYSILDVFAEQSECPRVSSIEYQASNIKR